MTEQDESRVASVRRAPRYGAFVGVGVIVAVIVTVAVTTAFPADPAVGMWPTVAYMSLYGIAAGIVLGAVAALIADRVSRRRARLVQVERGHVEESPLEASVTESPAPEPALPDVEGQA